MFKIGMTDRLSLYIIILFYSGAFIIGYNFLDKGHYQTILEADSNKKLVHLVLIKFKEQITSRQFQKLTDGAYNLQVIPVVEQLNFTKNISPEGLGKGYTHSLTMKFNTANDRDSIYLPHPIHKKFVDYFLPLTESVLVYDFWE